MPKTSGAAPAPSAPQHLSLYRAKRDFRHTPEPDDPPLSSGAGTGVVQSEARRFVVHKHWASRLHYDFRLELDGVLKSWAVPKGPSFDPRDKRMAVEVEDHPLAYADFEGVIPPHQYGAGQVIVWDSGAWQPVGDARQGIRDGHFKFELRGHKLRGKWALVRMKGKSNGQGEKQTPWLLIKEKDKFARPAEVFSVVDEMPDSVLGGAQPLALPPEAKPADLPALLAPQLATLVDKPPPQASDWLYEIKFDGYRLLARLDGEHVQLFTRNGNDWTARMPVLAAALKARQAAGLPPGWYDGEVVVMGPSGVPDFQALQQSFDTARTAELVYFLFDLPYVADHDVRALPQEVRRELLQQVLALSSRGEAGGGRGDDGRIRLSEIFDAEPAEVLQSACRLGLEGVIGKRRDAPYVSRRSPAWIKLKCGKRQEFVIGGYTDPRGARVGLGALLLGVHGRGQAGQLRYAGSVGTGFDDRTLGEIKKRLEALASSECPFAPSADLPRGAHWVRPELLAEVSFGEWTQGGRIRHPVFHGLRSDKPAREIVREQPASSQTLDRAASRLPPGLRVSHPERLVDAASGLHKIDLVRYYALVGPLMLPQLKGRPVALVRAPEGVGGELFFQKHADVRNLPGVRQLDPALYPGHPPMLEIATAEGLASIAQWNVIEVHSQNAVASAFSTPDRMVFDLDPGEGVAWAQVQEAAGILQSFLQELGLAPFLKTSGGKGLHVIVPLKKQHDWDTVKGFSQAVVAHLARLIPQRFVLKSGGKNRVGKIFIDYLRNGLGATTVAAWSARARPGMGISVPLDWTELSSLKGGDHWTVKAVHERLAVGNSPWDGYAKSATGLARPMQRLGFKPA